MRRNALLGTAQPVELGVEAGNRGGCGFDVDYLRQRAPGRGGEHTGAPRAVVAAESPAASRSEVPLLFESFIEQDLSRDGHVLSGTTFIDRLADTSKVRVEDLSLTENS
jgi:hypothetical protein